MNRQDIELAIHQKKMARETWYYTLSQAEAMIGRLTQELIELEKKLAGAPVNDSKTK